MADYCFYCRKKMHWWQKHNEKAHTRCQKVWRDGYDRAWSQARITLSLWRLPDLDEMFGIDNILAENPSKHLYEQRAKLERQIQWAYTEPTEANGMLLSGSFVPTEEVQVAHG